MEDGKTKRFKIVGTSGNHVGIELEKGDVENILFTIKNTEKLEVHRKFKHIENTTKNFCFCRKGFNTKEELFEHCYIEHSYVCVNCDNEYNTEEDLEDHIRKKHSQECEEKMECRNKREQQNIEKHRHEYICDLCNEEFNNESKLKKHWEINHKIHEEKKIGYLNGFATLTEDIMNGDKGIEDLQNYITGHRDIELEPTESMKIMGIVKLINSYFGETSSEDLELGSEGLMRHAQPKEQRTEEVGKNEKVQEINNRCLECNKELRNIEELRAHEKNCYNWYESREDLEDYRNEIHSIECEENLECECDQCGKWLVQEKKDKESINSKIVPKKNEFSDTISTIDNSSIDKIETEGENPERDKKIIGEPDKRHKITKESLQKNRKVEQNPEFINNTSNREKYVTEMLEIEGENPERDKETTKKQDKIQYTTKKAPMDKNNEKPNFHNENYSEEELKTNKNNNGKIFERIDKTDEENKTTEKMKNELGAKNSGNQAVCADTNDNPYNNKKHKNRMTVISQYSADREENDTTPSIN